ncbi:MAG: mechanosensitive ion channel [Deltaproteobacteria bacterium]|nr:mechanosensitive ion channel [Deltaproteobacteria bacterium]MCB9488931.1 mechanosensitive ion channel [Deltaproteobacteria bacterium]
MDQNVHIIEFIRVSGLITGLLVLVSAWLINQLLLRFSTRLGVRFTEKRMRIQQVGTFVRFFIYFAATFAAILLTFQLTDQLLLAMGGTIAVTLGFALKDTAASIIASLTILIDKPFQVGDRVNFAGYYGEITAIGLRSVRLVTLDDNLVTIPNNKFLTEIASTGNAGALDMLVQMDFFVGIDQDINRAKKIVSEAISSCRYAYLKKPFNVLVNQVIQENYFAVRLRAKVYVLDVQYEKALETDVTERVMAAFADQDIKPPAILHRTADFPAEVKMQDDKKSA